MSAKPNRKLYLGIFGALMVLTVLTVAVSWVHLPTIPAIALGLAIATFKAGLVAAFFMHLKGEVELIWALLGVTLFFMAVLFIVPLADTVAIQDKLVHAEPVAAAPHAEPAKH